MVEAITSFATDEKRTVGGGQLTFLKEVEVSDVVLRQLHVGSGLGQPEVEKVGFEEGQPGVGDWRLVPALTAKEIAAALIGEGSGAWGVMGMFGMKYEKRDGV